MSHQVSFANAASTYNGTAPERAASPARTLVRTPASNLGLNNTNSSTSTTTSGSTSTPDAQPGEARGGYCARWDDRTAFHAPTETFATAGLKWSVAAVCTGAISALHNSTMASDKNKWLKMAIVFGLNLALLPVVVLAVVETAVRLVLTILSSPMYLIRFCSETNEWKDMPKHIAASTLMTVGQIPNAFYTMYQSWTSAADINVEANTNTVTFNLLTHFA